MEASSLIAVLANTFEPQNDVRHAAEKKLGEFEKQPGYQTTLLHIITLNTIPVQVRQAAILRLKNRVKQFWFKKDDVNIPPQDRRTIKDNIVEAIIHQPAKVVRTQLVECLYHIIKRDYPDEWPELLPGVLNNFKNNDQKRIYGGLQCLHAMVKKYMYCSEKNRKPLIPIVEVAFPMLLSLFQTIINSTTPESGEMIRLIIKIFHAVTRFSIPLSLRKPDCIKAWMAGIIEILGRPMPAHWNNQSIEELSNTSLWKTKKWASRICNHLFTRFGRPTIVKDEGMNEFATLFLSTFAAPILQTFMNILLSHKRCGKTTSPVLQLSYCYLSDALAHACLYKLMKPHLHFIILESVLPTLCLTPDDLTLWSENPQEFVRRSLNVMEEFTDPKIAAQNLLIDLIKIRTRDTLQMTLTAVEKTFVVYAQAPDNQKNPILKDGAARVFGCLRKLLLSDGKSNQSIENIIVTHIFPDFSSPHGFLRAKSCWVVGEYSKLPYTNEAIHAQGVMLVTNSLNDPELPVKLEAVIAISRLVQEEKVVKFIEKKVPLILDKFFLLVNEIGNEEVIATLGSLINQIGKDIAPYALELTNRLSELFLKLVKADEEDDESALTAVQCIRALNNILYCVESIPEIYPQLENVLQKLIIQMLHPDGVEFLDDVLEMIVGLTYFPKTITPFMWSILPRIIKAFHEWAPDYLSDMMGPIDNYISKGTDIFATNKNPNYLHLLLSVCKRLMDDIPNEIDCQFACKLLETVMAHCRFKVDAILPDIIKMACNRLFIAKNKSLRLLLCDVVGGAAYYNPVLFLQIIYSDGEEFPKRLFNSWLSHLEHMEESHKHKKIAVLGFSSLCLVNLSQAPKTLQSSLAGIMNQVMKLLAQIKKDQEEEEGDEGDEDEESDYDEEVAFEDVGEDDDALDDIESMANWTAEVQKAFKGVYCEDVDEENYANPIHKVDEFVFFRSCFETLASKENVFSHQWMNSLNPKDKNTFEEIMKDAEQRKADETNAQNQNN